MSSTTSSSGGLCYGYGWRHITALICVPVYDYERNSLKLGLRYHSWIQRQPECLDTGANVDATIGLGDHVKIVILVNSHV